MLWPLLHVKNNAFARVCVGMPGLSAAGVSTHFPNCSREMLLEHSPHFRHGRLSMLAGFVEAGETLE